MSVSAANSLLKFIEEPANEQTYGILITEHKDNILSTIISRSMVINFDQIDKSLLKEQLTGVTEDNLLIDAISVVTSNFFDATNLVKDEDFNNICKVLDKYINQLLNSNPISLFYRANIDVLSNRDRMKTFLLLLECFYRDLYEYQITNNFLVFKSRFEEIKTISAKISSDNILEYLFQILELVKKISYNVNMNLLINQFLLEMDGGV
jgi:DNA polymerase-3 subunit delta'